MADRKTPPIYRTRGPADGEDWTAVAVALNDRMARRRIGQQDLARASGVSVSTLRELQHGAGRRVQNKTLTAIARALGWPDDHLIHILISSTPTGDDKTHEPPGQEILAILARLDERMTEAMTRLAAIEQAVTRSSSRPPS
ncbi:helix-turn-helix transcriptional regulator [Frankia sp. CiP3]|uniref:helix-turn-helix domain-containing protein n=1 Tax=Frankia sp. CiP3 TaxID=2880971 RepID=UPI001EF4EFDA|nr:helix-turn-helix transcriptional regulator [Frankia sp. CiP3]